jgi:hypothetical protein
LLKEIDNHKVEISAKAGKGYRRALELITKKLMIMPDYFYENKIARS